MGGVVSGNLNWKNLQLERGGHQGGGGEALQKGAQSALPGGGIRTGQRHFQITWPRMAPWRVQMIFARGRWRASVQENKHIGEAGKKRWWWGGVLPLAGGPQFARWYFCFTGGKKTLPQGNRSVFNLTCLKGGRGGGGGGGPMGDKKKKKMAGKQGGGRNRTVQERLPKSMGFKAVLLRIPGCLGTGGGPGRDMISLVRGFPGRLG